MTNGMSTSLQRAIDILTVLGAAAHEDRELGVSEVARRVGREKSQVSRSLKSLAESGLVDRDPISLAYRLGWRLFTLAELARNHNLVHLTAPVLQALVARCGEAAHLTILHGNHVLTVLSERVSANIQVVEWVGRSSPLYSTSSGRALLMWHSDLAIRRLLAGRADTPRMVPVDIDSVLMSIKEARRHGYVLVRDEFEPGLVAAAAPVLGRPQRVVAAINVSAPAFRLRQSLDVTGREVKAAADTVSRLLHEPPRLAAATRESGSAP